MNEDQQRAGLDWQVGVWNRISALYWSEIDRRFAPVVDALLARAALEPADTVLDIGCGTGALAERAAEIVGSQGSVLGVDVSPRMLELSRQRLAARGLANVNFQEGRAEDLPARNASYDAVVASLSLMFVIDRGAAARQIARVLRPGGRFVAAVWAGPGDCDIVLFQQTAGRFAGPPPVPGVGPGSLADPTGFQAQLAQAGIETTLETEIFGFEFENFESAWDVLAGVTTAHLEPDRRQQAKEAVMAAMYPAGDGPRRFRNATHLIVGRATK
jgi:SAM-dependent methyltransferase